MPGDEAAAPGYPALWISGEARSWPIPAGSASVLLGRSREADLRFADDPACSRRQAGIRADRGAHLIEPLSETVPVLVNGREIRTPHRLAHGDVVRFSSQELVYLTRPQEGAGRPGGDAGAGFPTAPDQTVLYRQDGGDPRPSTGPDAPAIPGEVPVASDILLGRAAEADLVLPHPTVSRRHAIIRLRRGEPVLTDLGSANGTFVNGARCLATTALAPGDVIDIGPYALTFTGRALVTDSREGNLRVIGRNLVRTVAAAGGRARILDDVSVVIEPNEFVALLGPSGSGKTTLLNALSARETASEGEVFINDINLYRNFGLAAEQMALVPQQDMLHEGLTLGRALAYTARLRLPSDLSGAAIGQEVDRVLASVEMTDRRGTLIGNLSGGQKKRASLANESLSRPSLLFLDEVTSGLDEGIDWEIMRLLRRMADGGMTIICVTHTLANVREFCHKVVVLGAGGGLVFSGRPEDALAHFGTERLADIYRVLPSRPTGTWRAGFERSSYHETYVAAPLRRFADQPARRGAATEDRSGRLVRRLREGARQFAILSERTLRLLLADRRTLAIALIQSVIIGGLLGYIFADVPAGSPLDASMLFLLGMTAFWLGCNGASKEIVKERPIYRRERDVNLSVLAYVGAKTGINSVFTSAQVALVFGLAVLVGKEMPGNDGAQLAIMLLAGVVGTALGLLISASVSSRDQATTLVPLALVPQFILSGAFVPELPGFIDGLAHATVSGLWTQEAMVAAARADVARVWTGAAVLVAHGIAFLAIAYLVLLIRDRRGKLFPDGMPGRAESESP